MTPKQYLLGQMKKVIERVSACPSLRPSALANGVAGLTLRMRMLIAITKSICL